VTKKKHSFRFELDKEMAEQFKEKLKAEGYTGFSDWARERIRDYMKEKRLSIE